MLRAVVPYLAYFYICLVGMTTRLRVRGGHWQEQLRLKNQRCIYAFWHQRQVFFTWSHRGCNVAILVSRSRDGEVIARVMKLLRIPAVRGSSSRGSLAAMREMIEAIARGGDVGITPDGPKGPAGQVKEGIVFLAQKLGIPILPITNGISRKIVLKGSWDHYQIPLPFGKAVLSYGKPIFVGSGDDLKARAEELKASLDNITQEADSEVLN